MNFFSRLLKHAFPLFLSAIIYKKAGNYQILHELFSKKTRKKERKKFAYLVQNVILLHIRDDDARTTPRQDLVDKVLITRCSSNR